jgi:hypothetical protein
VIETFVVQLRYEDMAIYPKRNGGTNYVGLMASHTFHALCSNGTHN